MPRNSSGTMSAPAGQPAVSGTVISSSVFNALVADLIAELTDSLSRSGKGPMTAPLKTPDGSVSAPAHSFTSETGTGWYRAATGDLRLAIAGVDLISFKNNTFQLLIAGNPIIQATGANSAISIAGNRAATDTGTDVAISATATRTAGTILRLQNGGSDKLLFDYQGLLQLASQAGPLQPTSIWTAITPNANWTAINGLAYWKDATGMVHLKGATTCGVGVANPPFTLPVGFRPLAQRDLPVLNTIGATLNSYVTISAAGVVTVVPAPANGDAVWFDAVTFLAEQ